MDDLTAYLAAQEDLYRWRASHTLLYRWWYAQKFGPATFSPPARAAHTKLIWLDDPSFVLNFTSRLDYCCVRKGPDLFMILRRINGRYVTTAAWMQEIEIQVIPRTA